MSGFNIAGIEIKLPTFSPITQQKSSENTTSGLQRGIQISMPGNNRSNQLSNSSLPGGKVGGSNGTTIIANAGSNIHVGGRTDSFQSSKE